MEDQMICNECEEVIEKGDYYTFDKDENPVCEGCEQNDYQYLQTAFVLENGERKEFKYSSLFGWLNEHYERVASDEVTGLEKFEHKSTSAWRGYYYPVLEDGYTTAMDGWATGRYEDVPWKHRFNDFGEALLDQKVKCPVPVIFAIGLTSNVFSTAIDVIVAEDDLDEFTRFVGEQMGYDIDELKHALS